MENFSGLKGAEGKPETEVNPLEKIDRQKIEKEINPRMRKLRYLIMGALLAAGSGYKAATATKKAIDFSEFGNKSVAGKMLEGMEVGAAVQTFGFIGETVEDISDALHKIGVQEEAEDNVREITVTHAGKTLQEIAEEQLGERYRELIGEENQNPVTRMAAYLNARHFARLNDVESTETLLPEGRTIRVDEGHAFFPKEAH